MESPLRVPVYCDHCDIALELLAPREALRDGTWVPPPCGECGHQPTLDLTKSALAELCRQG
ncbi:MAG: hypothetical protein AABZ30_07050 [Myxococcota bacterium]